MAAGRYDFTIEQGAYFERVITYKNEAGTPINLTGYTARLIARKRVGDAAAVINLTSGSGLALGGAAGTITISIADNVTAAYNFNQLIYNLELTPPSGNDVRLLKGIITLDKEVAL